MSYPYGGYYPQNNMRSPLPQVQSPMAVPQVQQDPFKVIPVASVEEATAIPTDFMGATMILPDFAHKAIYTKTFNPNTGLPIFLTFRLEETLQANSQPIASDYDPKTEIEKLYSELEGIKTRLAAMEPQVETEGKKK